MDRDAVCTGHLTRYLVLQPGELHACDLQPDMGEDGGFSETASPPRRFRPLKTLANVLTVLLISDVVLTTVVLVVQAAGGQSLQVRIDEKPAVVLSRVTFLVTAIAFLVWFSRAMTVAESQG